MGSRAFWQRAQGRFRYKLMGMPRLTIFCHQGAPRREMPPPGRGNAIHMGHRQKCRQRRRYRQERFIATKAAAVRPPPNAIVLPRPLYQCHAQTSTPSLISCPRKATSRPAGTCRALVSTTHIHSTPVSTYISLSETIEERPRLPFKLDAQYC